MSLSVYVVTALVALAILYWVPVRGWYRRSEARRLERARAMSGDADLLAADYESTLAIAIAAPPTDVWPRLLEMGRSDASLRPGKEPTLLAPGDVLRFRYAPAFPIHSIDPGRTLILGDGPGLIQWRWQFELYAVAEGRTRLLSRTRFRSGASLGSKLFALVLRPVAFVITRKMLLDVKRRAERDAREGAHAVRAAS